jgi:hypothetical protein
MENEMARLSDRDYIIKTWKEDGQKVLEAIDRQDIKAMDGDEFLSHCTACGGNWGGMFLTGIKELYPGVYEAIPEQMGRNAFFVICSVLELLQINFAEEK